MGGRTGWPLSSVILGPSYECVMSLSLLLAVSDMAAGGHVQREGRGRGQNEQLLTGNCFVKPPPKDCRP